jgi:hypothetical protein
VIAKVILAYPNVFIAVGYFSTVFAKKLELNG